MNRTRECGIVRDLIPLHIDRAASESSERFIAEHLENCAECRKYLEETAGRLVIPAAAVDQAEERKSFKKFRKLINKKLIIAVVVTAAITLLLIGCIVIPSRVEIGVDPSEVDFRESDGRIAMSYSGEGDLRWRAWSIESEYGSKTLVVEFWQTLWDRYVSPIYDREEHIYYLGEADKVSVIFGIDGEILWTNTPYSDAG